VVLAGDLARNSCTLPGTVDGCSFMLSRLRLVDFLGESVFSVGLPPILPVIRLIVLGLEYITTAVSN